MIGEGERGGNGGGWAEENKFVVDVDVFDMLDR